MRGREVSRDVGKRGHPTADGKTDLTGLRLLVVDDEPDTLEIISLVLSQHQARAHTTAFTSAAFEVFHEWKPSVLVSDLGMPGEDGFELISKVRALPPEQGGDVPAVALTAYVREEDRLRALAAGYELHIKKPVDPNTLARAVAQLGKRKS